MRTIELFLDITAGAWLGVGFIACALFVLIYHRAFPWWKTPDGRGVMLRTASLVVISLIYLMTLLLGPEYYGRHVVRWFGYAFFGLSSSYLTWAIYQLARTAPDREAPLPWKDGDSYDGNDNPVSYDSDSDPG